MVSGPLVEAAIPVCDTGPPSGAGDGQVRTALLLPARAPLDAGRPRRKEIEESLARLHPGAPRPRKYWHNRPPGAGPARADQRRITCALPPSSGLRPSARRPSSAPPPSLPPPRRTLRPATTRWPRSSGRHRPVRQGRHRLRHRDQGRRGRSRRQARLRREACSPTASTALTAFIPNDRAFEILASAAVRQDGHRRGRRVQGRGRPGHRHRRDRPALPRRPRQDDPRPLTPSRPTAPS